MSNYIYNNDFNNQNPQSPQPIKMNLEENKPSLKLPFVIIIACALALSSISGLIGLLIGINSVEPETKVKNTVYTNVVYKSPAETTDLLENKTYEGLTRADIIELVQNTVVEIQTTTRTYTGTTAGAGSGVIVGNYETSAQEKGYYIVTNAHVVEGTNSNEIASSITAVLRDGTKYKASVVGYDSLSDIAVLSILEPTRVLQMASFTDSFSSVRVGDEVIAIGNPLGELGGTVTNGYVSALDREILVDGKKMNLMQTDAAINPGNSGGGLFNMKGELIGIVNAKSSGEGIEGLGFAIPANDAYKIYFDLINDGYVTGRPTLGISVVTNGGYVQVVSVSDSDKVSLEVGDKILYVRPLGSSTWSSVTADSLINLVSTLEKGDKLELFVYRNGIQTIITAEIFEHVPSYIE